MMLCCSIADLHVLMLVMIVRKQRIASSILTTHDFVGMENRSMGRGQVQAQRIDIVKPSLPPDGNGGATPWASWRNTSHGTRPWLSGSETRLAVLRLELDQYMAL